ncbi:putative damage-inducible protein DinB [Chitinophaga niastensis]|uniref:Putative damage-inducible protein DinB n=1 Tax=Chitinophaga niastensis TaxID=536980 RepID=A0A2P8H905_CHINA|nr:DinB family protein [Chitinophaga niastensis]PSL42702.1 putative damage-inducible protein DinB [Chitinophaga niastensis]
MENNTIAVNESAATAVAMPPAALLEHWKGHRRLTRRVIEAFPEDQLFIYSIGGMRPFSAMAIEMLGLAKGLQGIVTNDWQTINDLMHHSRKSIPATKEEILHRWDALTIEIDTLWAQIPAQRFQEIVNAFGKYEGPAYSVIMYWIDNEIHHRGQGTVYLRALGIEPPAFWNRD